MVCWTRAVRASISATIRENFTRQLGGNRDQLIRQAREVASRSFIPGEEEKLERVVDEEITQRMNEYLPGRNIDDFVDRGVSDLEQITVDFAQAAQQAVLQDANLQTATVDSHEFGESAVLTFFQVLERTTAGWTFDGIMPTLKQEIVEAMLRSNVFVPEDRASILAFIEGVKLNIYGEERDLFGSIVAWYQRCSELPAPPPPGESAQAGTSEFSGQTATPAVATGHRRNS